MKEAFSPAIKAAVAVAFIAGVALMVLDPPQFSRLEELAMIIAGAIAIILIAAWLTTLAIGEEMPESEYRRLAKRSAELARLDLSGRQPDRFDELVGEALDELPEQFQQVLSTTPVLVSDEGWENRAYGMYIGDTVARGNHPNRIVIYRDTLLRDFGHDADLLRAQVKRTVRHEIAHHLGWDEAGVRNLGL